MKSIQLAIAALAFAFTPVASHAGDTCSQCCGDNCAACCQGDCASCCGN